ncbi:amino acid adenylation domain-containing protein [Streptomyces sp. NPDC015350]|uniref:amino acid adenylation domain-containing protein n=1 Tax=Streptomyces sp. NPDC015350 TaxID=3364955 RepID=UPI0037000F89
MTATEPLSLSEEQSLAALFSSCLPRDITSRKWHSSRGKSIRPCLAIALPLAALASRFACQEVVTEAIEVDGRPHRFRMDPGLMRVPLNEALLERSPEETADAQLRVDATLRANGAVVVTVSVAPTLFPAGAANAFATEAAPFIVAAHASSSRPLCEVPAMTNPLALRLVADLNTGRPAAWPVGTAVHELLVRRALSQPTAIAVTDGTTTVDYAELLGRAHGLTAALTATGVRVGDAVGVLLWRGIDSVVAAVAVSMAGAVCVPLDPAYPAQRIRLMLAHPRMRCVVTTDELSASLPSRISTVTNIAKYPLPVPYPALPVPTEQVATVMYTSGSTGVPKGVEITHSGIVRLVTDDESIGLTSADVMLHLAPTTFDASLLEIWGALAAGARLEVAPNGPLSMRELADLICDRGITCLWLTAGLFHQIAQYEPDCFTAVRRLFVGGDVVASNHVRGLLERHPGLEIVNGYGPTENTTFTTTHLIRSAKDLGEDTVPIGRPVAGTRVYLLDEYGQPVPPGVPGEVWTSGAGLATGYLEQSELTAERFVTWAEGPLAGERTYRTGDLCRITDQGVLAFLGRLDSQVKVNGFRIEPAEVEAAIDAIDQVQQSCVLVERDPSGAKRTVAFLVGEGETKSLIRSVRAALLKRIPAFMVPARFVVLEHMPLTSSGKVDRAALKTHTKGPIHP